MQTKYTIIQNERYNAIYLLGDYNEITEKWNGAIKVFQKSFDKKYEDNQLGLFEGDFTGLSLSGEGVFRGRFQDYIKMMTASDEDDSYDNSDFFYNFVHKFQGFFNHALPQGLGKLYSVAHKYRFNYVHEKELVESLIFKGLFEKGYICGKGIQFSLDGWIYYEGDWITLKYNESADPASTYKTNHLFSIDYRVNEHMSKKFHGTGRFYYDNKLLYSGDWYFGRFHGSGTLYNLDNGSPHYTGTWQYGSPHGLGVEYQQTGTILYRGDWKNGNKHGWGTLYNNEEEILFYGEFKNNQMTDEYIVKSDIEPKKAETVNKEIEKKSTNTRFTIVNGNNTMGSKTRVAKIGAKKGVIGRRRINYNKWIVDPNYNEILIKDNLIVTIIQEGDQKKYGLRDEEGYIHLDDCYDYIRVLDENKVLVEHHGKQGIVNKKGDIIIPYQYEKIVLHKNFNNNQYYFLKNNGNWGVADTKNTILVPLNYKPIETYQDEHIIVKSADGLFALYIIGKNGPEFTFDDYKYFKNIENHSHSLLAIRKDNKWGVIKWYGSKGFQQIINCDNDLIEYDYHSLIIQQNHRYGLTDLDGNCQVPIQFEKYSMNRIGLNGGHILFTIGNEKKYYYPNDKLFTSYELANDYKNFHQSFGYFLAKGVDGLFGIINSENTVTLPFNYLNIDKSTCSHIFSALDKKKKWGYYSSDNHLFIPHVFDLRKKGRNAVKEDSASEYLPSNCEIVDLDGNQYLLDLIEKALYKVDISFGFDTYYRKGEFVRKI